MKFSVSVRTAEHAVFELKLPFIIRSGSNSSVFYLYRPSNVGLSSNPLLCACISMDEVWLPYGKVHTLHRCSHDAIVTMKLNLMQPMKYNK